MIKSLCERENIDQNNIYELCTVGNTVMENLFLGIEPRYLAVSPFNPTIKDSLDIKARQLNLERQIWEQLGLKVKFKAPPTLENELLSDNKKKNIIISFAMSIKTQKS